jgi:hypothetical protein
MCKILLYIEPYILPTFMLIMCTVWILWWYAVCKWTRWVNIFKYWYNKWPIQSKKSDNT